MRLRKPVNFCEDEFIDRIQLSIAVTRLITTSRKLKIVLKPVDLDFLIHLRDLIVHYNEQIHED